MQQLYILLHVFLHLLYEVLTVSLHDEQPRGLNWSYSVTPPVETLGPIQELFTWWFVRGVFYMLKCIVWDFTTGIDCLQTRGFHVFFYTWKSVPFHNEEKKTCMYFTLTLSFKSVLYTNQTFKNLWESSRGKKKWKGLTWKKTFTELFKIRLCVLSAVVFL